MAQATLLARQIEAGNRLLGQMFREGMDVTTAFWAKESDTGKWFLYVATPLVRDGGSKREAYGRILPLVNDIRKQGSPVDSFEIKLIGPKDPIAKDVLDHRGTVVTPWGRFGDLVVDEAYIYPSIEKLLSDLRDAAIRLCFALKKIPWPAGMHRRDLPRQVERRETLLGEVRSALTRVGERLGMGEYFGSLRDERIKILHLMGGPTWRREAIEKLLRAETMATESPPAHDAEAFDLLEQAILTLGENLRPSYVSEKQWPKAKDAFLNPNLDPVVG